MGADSTRVAVQMKSGIYRCSDELTCVSYSCDIHQKRVSRTTHSRMKIVTFRRCHFAHDLVSTA